MAPNKRKTFCSKGKRKRLPEPNAADEQPPHEMENVMGVDEQSMWTVGELNITARIKNGGQEDVAPYADVKENYAKEQMPTSPVPIKLPTPKTSSSTTVEPEVKSEIRAAKAEPDDVKVDVKPNTSSNNIQDQVKIYNKVLDIPFFAVDEVKVDVVDRKVIIECRKESSVLGVKSGYLQYSLELPMSIDISSIRTKWAFEEIEIEADLI